MSTLQIWTECEHQYGLALALGQMAPLLRSGLINGMNPSVSSTFEDVQDVGGVLPVQTSAVAMQVVSSSASDTAAGTGARTVQVDGIGADGAELSQSVTLNGTSQVAVPAALQHVQRVLCTTFGSGAANAGDVTVSTVSGSVALCRALAGNGTSQNSVYMVPSTHSWTLGTFFMNADNGTNTVHWRFGIMLPGSGGWVYPAIFFQGDNALPVELRPYPPTTTLPSGARLKWQARCPGGGTANVSVGMIHTLVANNVSLLRKIG